MRHFKSVILAAILCSPTAIFAQGFAGPYLAASSANYDGSFASAAEYYARALQADPTNAFIEQNALVSYVAAGDFAHAFEIAKNVGPGENLYVDMVLMSAHAASGDFSAARDSFPPDNRQVSALLAGLLDAWISVGTGDNEVALAAFDAMDQNDTVALYGQYHKGLALAYLDDFPAAAEILNGEDGPLHLDLGAIQAHIQVLSQLDQNAAALALLTNVSNGDPLKALRDQLEAGDKIAFTQIDTPAQGMAQALTTMAAALSRDEPNRLALFYVRLAQQLDPDYVDAMMTAADILEGEKQYDLASAAFALVPDDALQYKSAAIGQAEVQRRGGNVEGATQTLIDLAEAYPMDVNVLNALGDIYRGAEKFAEADAAYTRAIDNLQNPPQAYWVLFYTRGISNERLGEWAEAEADFRRALELSPNEPIVLNYLGYSFIEMQTNMDEAQKMIETASANAPDNGAITDSLAWVLYRLGKFEEAVPHMERAARQMPVDPVINDHLGDVLWMVGRKVEARFQWRRALSFEPAEVDEARIRRKLDVGLDVVLEEETDI